jgi:hypothetical protein
LLLETYQSRWPEQAHAEQSSIRLMVPVKAGRDVFGRAVAAMKLP